MTKRQIAWLIVFAAALLAALALRAGLLVFALYVLLGVLLLSRYLTRQWVGNLVAERETTFPDPVEAGSEVEVRVRLRNQGRFAVAWVLVEDLLPEGALRQKPPRVRIVGRRLKIALVRAGRTTTLKYRLVCEMRGYYQIGPTLLETGDLFGLERRHRVVAKAAYLLVLPRVVPLPRYDFASQRPIGEINLAHRLYEDPTRNAGVRPYQVGDPLQRVHWRATARTGALMCRIFDATTLAGASILLDFHQDGYPSRGEPYRSELAITVAVSLAYAVSMLNQQIGLVSNGRDAADRLRLNVPTQSGPDEEAPGFETRHAARAEAEMLVESSRLRPVVVETRRGIENFQRTREALARLELTDGIGFVQLLLETTPRLPRDATVIAILPQVSIETAMALGSLRRQGFAVTAVLIGLEDDLRSQGHGRLLAENIRDVRYVNGEEELGMLGDQAGAAPNPYTVEVDLGGD
jgi:uncharacterized protein (DUF58 family)